MSGSAEIFLWQEHEISFTAVRAIEDPYRSIAWDVKFTHESGREISRPVFWDGGNTWRVRFAPTLTGLWTWKYSEESNFRTDATATLNATKDESAHLYYTRGFWNIPKGSRNLIHADGQPGLLVGDTAWALPWRATIDDVRVYAADRQNKGFNASLLMTMQPDMRAIGPRARGVDQGFEVAFEDMKDGHLNEINIDYFKYLDEIISVLVEHEIVPVYQPLFFGFGWKGLDVAGPVVPPEEYARYCRYLVARFGARPAIYLVGADGTGYEPQIQAGGEEIEKCDAYCQPTGLHYRPHSLANAHQSAEWLDFQWCQTGHGGEHIQERVRDLWRNQPVKAVANGEPTYEQSGSVEKATGWWQGHEAWANLFAGGTMGVIYGAGSLWMWRVHSEEAELETGFLSPHSGWREALSFDGSRYVGLIGKILSGLPIAQMQPYWENVWCPRGLLVPNVLFLVYQENGDALTIFDQTLVPKKFRVVDPRSGEILSQGQLKEDSRIVGVKLTHPTVYIFSVDI